ncbi:MAG: ATP-grasp domain-containing protein [Clostridia bacterium]|nr:ATP-grasp domain-containing protein [Clostridia bacterium]
MRGIIVYNEQSLRINGFFASKLKAELFALGAEVEVVTALPDYTPDFAVMRVYDEGINAHLDNLGVRTFNTSTVAAICNDKWKTYELLNGGGIPVAPTVKAEIEDKITFPCVVKARHGHGGSEVFWAENEDTFAEIKAKMTDSAIVQPPVGKRGKDLRVYVLNGEPIVGMLRSSDKDFRSNFSLGGSASRYELSKTEEQLVKKVASLISADFVGIDFFLGDGGLICNELEDVVGCRMVYTYTDIDIIKKFAEHIVCAVKMGKNA